MKQHLIDFRNNWRKCVITFVLAFAGALFFDWVKLPLPWVTGPLFVTAVLALSGYELWMPLWLRPPSLTVLGILFGSAISPEFVDQFIIWLPSMFAVLIFVIVTLPIITAYFYFAANYDFVTSLLSAAPGGLIPMTILGESYGADDRVIAFMQTLRLILTVLTIPLAFRIFAGYVPSGNIGTGGSFIAFLPGDVLPILAACLVGYYLARLARLPAPELMGPMIMIGVLRLNGWIESEVPESLIAVAQVFIGISIALRFNGTRIREIATDLFHGTLSSLAMIGIAVLFAIMTAEFVSSSAQSLILAFTPGGFAEMALVGFGLGVQISFVVSHQLVRFFFIVLGIPVLMAVIRGKPKKINSDR